MSGYGAPPSGFGNVAHAFEAFKKRVPRSQRGAAQPCGGIANAARHGQFETQAQIGGGQRHVGVQIHLDALLHASCAAGFAGNAGIDAAQGPGNGDGIHDGEPQVIERAIVGRHRDRSGSNPVRNPLVIASCQR